MYRYKAVNPAGEIENGEIDAPGGEPEAVAVLQEAGYLPIRVEPAQAQKSPLLPSFQGLLRRDSASLRDLEFFARELATLLEAGLPLDQALQTLVDVADKPALRKLVTAVEEDVRSGHPLSTALARKGSGIPEPLTNMIRAGETTGSLDSGLAGLADYLQRARELRESILSALLYPAILLIVACLSIVALLVFVLPQFAQMFADLGVRPPWSTRLVLGAGDALRNYGWIAVLAALAALAGTRRWLADPTHRLRFDRLALRLPLAGELMLKAELARFTRTLGTMVAHGVPLVSSLEMVPRGVRNTALRETLAGAADGLRSGQGLARSLDAGGLLPGLAIKLIRIGEESGKLEQMLLRLADIYEREVRTALQRALTILEPALIVGLGIVVAGIVLTILSALLGINQAVL